jgi:hypothetical protein
LLSRAVDPRLILGFNPRTRTRMTAFAWRLVADERVVPVSGRAVAFLVGHKLSIVILGLDPRIY